MQSTHHLARTKRQRRAGLAPLELVLSLPIMLFVMALIIDFGNMAPWKTRAANVAREAAWREHWPHQGGNNPLPASWPANSTEPPTAQKPYKDASLGRRGAQPSVLSVDPFASHTVVRGPTAITQLGQPVYVDDTKVDFTSGLVEGTSHIELRLPLLPGLPHFVYDLRHTLLDNQFTYSAMGYPSNDSRRALLLYSIGLDAGLMQQYAQALMEVYRLWAVPSPTETMPTAAGVMTLDRDDEFLRYLNTTPNFHPPFRSKTDTDPSCETDRELVRLERILAPGRLVYQIQGETGGGRRGLPQTMAEAFISMYRIEIARLEALNPKPQAEIDALNRKIDQLNTFIGTLN